MSTTLPDAPPSGPEVTHGIIDCDVHPHFEKGLQDIVPYMTESWRQRLGFGSDKDWSKNFAAAQYILPLDTLYINAAGPTREDASQDGGMPGSDPAFVAEQLLDGHNIHRAILIAGHLFGIGAFPDPTVAATVASAYNEWQQEKWVEFDTRYRGLIAVAPQHPQAAVEEIERWAGKPGIVGVFIPLHNIAAGEMHWDPVYEAAQRHSLPIVYHVSGTECVYHRAPVLAQTPTYYLEWHTALSQVHMSNTLSLLCHGTFEKFPELKVCIAEGGWMWAIEVMLKLDRDWKGLRNEVPWVKRPPSEYLRRNMKFTTQPFPEMRSPEHVKTILEMVHADETLVFSSDYPHWDFDDPNRALNDIPPDLRQKICVDNGEALFGDRLK